MSAPTYTTLLLSIRDKVCWIELNRPKRKNSFSNEMYLELIQAFDWCAKSKSVHVVVLTGNPSSQPHEFYSSGNDLANFTSQMSKPDLDIPALTKQVGETCRAFVDAFIDFPKPLIGAVNGPAFGIAVTSLQLCDLIYTNSKATFTTPFTSLAQNPEGCSSILFPQRLGQKANQLLLLGETLNAEQAERHNFTTGIFPDATFREDVHKVARKLASFPLHSVLASKELVRKQQRAALKAANKDESQVLTDLLNDPRTMEAVVNRMAAMKAKL